ncbi:MAG: ornithine carbamoyltransferase [Methanomassiliicoccales archaeon]|jgi:ornithine carbamoyltransferase|nr:ornithine carbamoyltransferase [Methanomassiliicoccales archaeon]
MKRDVISVRDLEFDMDEILSMALDLKSGRVKKEGALKGKTLAMIFEKPSTRTRVSFEVGMAQLGGHALYLSPRDLQIGRGETIADTAKVLSRYVDAIVYRAFSHEMMLELAKNATVPVINGLDDLEHPCQIVADLLTVKEKKGKLKGIKMAYVGDGNNVCNSLLLGAAIVGMDFVAACPDGYKPNDKIVADAISIAKRNKCLSKVISDPHDAVKDADVVYTDVWTSMGQEKEAEEREKVFAPYQVNSKLLANAKDDCIVMHCLPAHRGHEITDEVIDGEQSVVFDQAENRLHAQQAILLRVIR